MASTKFKKTDKNRFKKVYPYLRVRPKNHYVADREVVMEIGAASFSDEDTKVYLFAEHFTSAPNIVGISVDSESNDTANVNVYVTAVTTTSVKFVASSNFTGQVHFHAIMIGQ
jgi:hypothetical protein